MTKTVLTILITICSMTRLAMTGILYYYEEMHLPTAAVVVSVICSLLMLLIAGRCYLLQLSGKNLRFALFVGAFAAVVNMVLVLLAQPGSLTTAELLVSGTIFDPLLFIGSCTIKIRDTRGITGRSPFSRRVHNNDR